MLLVVFVFLFINCIHGHAHGYWKDYKLIEATDSYYKFHNVEKTWTEAQKQCSMEGAALFHPLDEVEANAVLQYWNESRPTCGNIFLGANSILLKGVFETIDGVPLDELYNKWDDGEPNDTDGIENCVVMAQDNGLLMDYSCNNTFEFICKKQKADITWNTRCNLPDSQYDFHDDAAGIGKCYKLHTKVETWNDAHAVCNAEQSYLAVIDSQAEKEYISNYIASKTQNIQTSPAIYLGFHNLFENLGWITLKGTPIEGTVPGSDDSYSLCGSMTYKGDLNAARCSDKNMFICEHDTLRKK